jgi:hypothetical protein
MPILKTLNVPDEIQNRVQDNTKKAIDQLSNQPLTNGTILSSIALTTGNNTVNHKLGKKLTGWFIVRQRSSATIYDNQDSNKAPTQTLILVSSADVTVDIYVF